MQNKNISLESKILVIASYLTGGFIGFVAMIICAINKKNLIFFSKYNILQSIFLSIILFLIGGCLKVIFSIMSIIPFLQYLVAQISFFLNRPFIFNYSIINLFIIGLIGYCIYYAIQGKNPKIYWISDIIDYRTK